MGHISVKDWRMSRGPFAAYIGLFALCILGFASMDLFNWYAPRLETYLWLGGALLLLCLPLISTMRSRDIGLSALWPLLTLAGLLVLFGLAFSAIVSVSGTPGSGSGPSMTDRALVLFGIASLALLCLMSIAGLVLPSQAFKREASA